MSRVGKLPIKIPTGVNVTIEKTGVIISGPKGTLSQFAMPGVDVTQTGDELVVRRTGDQRQTRSKHGLMRALLNNMITGVNQGFSRQLEINGVGFRVQQQGSDLKFNLGFSHEITYKVPEGIQVAIEQNIITISGADKQQVGQVASEIRGLKKPEPYKGKGIKYLDERIIRKSGKTGKEATA